MKQSVKIQAFLLLVIFITPFTGSFSTADDAVDFKVANLHLSWKNDVKTTMAVSWRTLVPTDSIVQYGLNDSYGIEGVGLAGPWHHVELIGLSPDTTYHYRAGNGDIWSRDYTFTTGTLSNHTNFICLGDAQQASQQRKDMVTSIDRVAMDMMLYTGDFVDTSTVIEEYHKWFRDYESVTTDTPTMGVMGNHEKNFTYFYTIWQYPGNEHYYSFDYGPVHIIGLHTYDIGYITLGGNFSDQAEWLRADLEANEDALWTIVMMHIPPFSSFQRYYQGEYDLINETFVPIFEEFDVDLVLTGHDHTYERLFCNDVNYIISGGAGSSLYQVVPSNILNISVHIEESHNFLYFDISEDKLHVKAYRPDYSFIDQLILNKEVKPDLSFQTLPLTYKQEWDQNLEMNIVITNTGDENISTSTTAAYTVLDTVQILDIPPLDIGEKHIIPYNWSLGGPDQRTYTFELDYDSTLDEVSEDNNVLVIKFIGQEKEETPTDEGAFLSGLLGSLILVLSLIVPVVVKKRKKV